MVQTDRLAHYTRLDNVFNWENDSAGEPCIMARQVMIAGDVDNDDAADDEDDVAMVVAAVCPFLLPLFSSS
ncbi:hypothetical protein E2C01_052346 [Portunus trituberculatus]|uniref:Uncharacterized protein n=1 Tax=Portunus trituberculatus TaxID=210409 RepID=A0A5B7GM80_PORTR|nr:hypothetical protein [Portunus trituberculatus]